MLLQAVHMTVEKAYPNVTSMRNAMYGSNPTPRTVPTGTTPPNTGAAAQSPVVGSTTTASRGPDTQALSNTARRAASGDVASKPQSMDPKTTTGIQTINKMKTSSDQANAQRAGSIGAPAGGNYASAVRKAPPSVSPAAREPDAQKGSTSGSGGIFRPLQQTRQNNYADRMNTQARIANARKSGNETSLKGNDAWQNRISKPDVQRDANFPAQAAQRKANDARMTDRLKAREPVERAAPAATSTSGQAQAGTPAKVGDTGVKKTTNAATKPKTIGDTGVKKTTNLVQANKAKEQTFGQAFAAARKKAGGAGGKFTYKGKVYQTNVKGEKYRKASKLKSVNEETVSEQRIVKKSHKTVLGRLEARRGQEQQGGRVRRYKVTNLAETIKKAIKKHKSNEIDFEPENNNPIQ